MAWRMDSSPEAQTQPDGFSAHTVRLARILSVAYLLVIVYASLRPFHGWRMPPEEVLHFLVAPWPRFTSLPDIAVNFGAYVPLGFLLSIAMGARHGPARAVAAATLAAALLSLAMEALQMFLPPRIASNVDLLANSLGALVGAMAAPVLAPTRALGARLHSARHRLFREGMMADAGFVILMLWVCTQFHPTAQPFGTGAFRVTFDLPAYTTHTPLLAFGSEAAVVTFNLLGIGLMLSALLRGTPRTVLVAGCIVGIALVVKWVTIAVLAQAPTPFTWLTPGVLVGLVAGTILLFATIRLPRTARLAVAATCVAVATAAINLAPDNPYQNVPPQFLARGSSHFLSFSGIVRALSELWPLLAIGYLAFALGARERDGDGNPL
jgi:VanZ family protein